MSITPITTDQLRRIADYDGLILQGCGGSLQEWQDGINNLLTETGILKDGSRFENIHVFQHEGRTCLLFPFEDDVQINMGKLARWRLQSHEQFEGMWLSDYVDLRLGGPLQEQQHNGKPDCPLIGEDSNIFNLMAIASRTLKENGLPEQAREMRQRIEQSHTILEYSMLFPWLLPIILICYSIRHYFNSDTVWYVGNINLYFKNNVHILLIATLTVKHL